MVITRSEALECGLHTRAILRRVSAGAWQTLFPATYFIGYGAVPWEARVRAACSWAGSDAVASHVTAATLHGFKIPPSKEIHVSIGHRKNSTEGVKVHFDPARAAARKVWVGRLPTTTVERTLLDLCAGIDRATASELVASVIRMGKTNLGRLHRLLEALDHPGPRGSKMLRSVLKHRFAGGVTDSRAEDAFLRIAKKRFPHLEHHHIVRRNEAHIAELDFAFVPEKLNIEIDGDQFHSDPASVQRDKERDALLGELGWQVVRFTYWHLIEKPEWVIAVVEQLLARRRSQLSFYS